MNLRFDPHFEQVLEYVFSTPGIIQQHEWELRTFLRMALDELKPEATVELGSWKGYTGTLLSHVTLVKTVSIDNAQFGRYEDKALEMGRNLSFIIADCTSEQTVDSVARMLGKPIDLVFADDSHIYEELSKEVEIWKNRMRPGGWIVFHDINPLANKEPNGEHAAICQAHRFWNDLKGDKQEIIATAEHKQWRGVIPHGGLGILRV